MQEQERERYEQQAIEQEYLRRLQAGDDPAQLAYERSARLAKAAARKKQAMEDLDSVQNGRSSLLKGLRKKKVVVEELPPIDPFGGMPHADSYFSVSKDYPGDRTFANFDRDAKFTAGGYDKQEWYRWALLDAFAGLGVAIEDEKAEDANLISAGEAMAVT
jgi:CDK-activating kinase assembly factor MAT1